MTLQSYGTDAADAEIRTLAPWFHNLHLPDGRQTAPDHPLGDFPSLMWERLAGELPADLRGARALDIGCNAGFYSIELARRGADVVAIDHDPHYLRQASWALERHDLAGHVDLRLLGVYDLPALGETFDVVLFLGVLYHLRYPMLALDLVVERTHDTLVLQTLTMPGGRADAELPDDLGFGERERLRDPDWPAMAFVEQRLAGDPTNWWVPSAPAVEAMVRTTGCTIVSRPGRELWVCKRTQEPPHRAELLNATGRDITAGITADDAAPR